MNNKVIVLAGVLAVAAPSRADVGAGSKSLDLAAALASGQVQAERAYDRSRGEGSAPHAVGASQLPRNGAGPASVDPGLRRPQSRLPAKMGKAAGSVSKGADLSNGLAAWGGLALMAGGIFGAVTLSGGWVIAAMAIVALIGGFLMAGASLSAAAGGSLF